MSVLIHASNSPKINKLRLSQLCQKYFRKPQMQSCSRRRAGNSADFSLRRLDASVHLRRCLKRKRNCYLLQSRFVFWNPVSLQLPSRFLLQPLQGRGCRGQGECCSVVFEQNLGGQVPIMQQTYHCRSKYSTGL